MAVDGFLPPVFKNNQTKGNKTMKKLFLITLFAFALIGFGIPARAQEEAAPEP
jgi:hypothetical protein